MADFAAGPEGKPLRLGSILARIGLVWHAQIAAQHIDAGLPVLGPVISQARHGIHPGQPDRRRLIITQLPGRRGEPFIQGPGALLRERSVQLLTLRRERFVQLLMLLFECLFGCPGLVARRPTYCAASVPIRVRTLTLAAMIAAVTSAVAGSGREII